MENNFKYIFNGEEKSKEQFVKLAKNTFKWFNNSSINAVDFDSVSSFFSGEYKTDNEIDKHFKGVLADGYKKEAFDKLVITPDDGKEQKSASFYTNSEDAQKIKEKNYPNLGDYLNKEEKVFEDWNKKEFYITPPSKENLDKMCDSFEQRVKNNSDKCGILNPLKQNFAEAGVKVGQKHNKLKAPLDILQTRQFPKALQLLALATSYGNHKYKDTDLDFLNFKRVEGGSQTYLDASARHSTNRDRSDIESGLYHIIHAVWNQLAALEIWAEENKIDIDIYSKNYLKSLEIRK